MRTVAFTSVECQRNPDWRTLKSARIAGRNRWILQSRDGRFAWNVKRQLHAASAPQRALKHSTGGAGGGTNPKSGVCQFRKFNGSASPNERADVTWIGKFPMNAARRARAWTRAAAVPNGVGWGWAVPSLLRRRC